jgi:hypothetical protein
LTDPAADRITIWANVIDRTDEDPITVTWNGPCPWPRLPGKGEGWECCYDPAGIVFFEQVTFRGPGGRRDESATVEVSVSAAHARHLLAEHGFTEEN